MANWAIVPRMKNALVFLLAAGLAAPVASEETENGLSLMERGAQLFMEGILREMEPALEGFEDIGPQLRDFAREMGPALGELLEQVQDWSAYHPPEILPNGDIIIRRKQPEDEPESGGSIDL